MTEPTDDETVTLESRLVDGSRSVSEDDLIQVTVFLYETLGRWYELKPGGRPPSVDPSDIAIRIPPDAGGVAGAALLDDGETLQLRSPASPEPDGNHDEIVDERDGVFTASAGLAQVALGRHRNDDESWDDVIQQLEAADHPALAYALWVGLATEPEARYPTIGQWRRSVDAAIRSDAATASMLTGAETPSRRVPLLAALAALAIVVAGGAFLLVGRGGTTTEDAGTTTSEPEAPTISDDGSDPDQADTTTTAAESGDDSAALGDACALVGPLGPVTIDQVSDIAIVVAWTPSTEAVNILLDGAFVDTVPPEAFRYVIERLPLSDQPLNPDTEYTVAVEPLAGEPSTACTTTLANPVPGSEALIGVTAPTGLEVVDTSSTSITVSWDPRPGADVHNLYLDGTYLQFGDVGGSSTIGDETEFTFVDLDPDTSYEIGIRRVEGPNQSGVVSITASTDPG